MPLLAVLFEPLGLGEGGGGLFTVHCIQQVYLFLFFEERQLIGWIKGDFLLVYHVQQFGNQLGEADITLDLSLAFSRLIRNKRNRSLRLLANLARS